MRISPFFFLSTLILGFAPSSDPLVITRADVSERAEIKSEPLDQLMFFAVSEGLYREGVKNDDVDIILAQAEGEGGTLAYVNFVYGCGLCTPSLNAFRNYRERQLFFASKTHARSFGKGLGKVERVRLRSKDPQVRLNCLQGMIQRWIKQRLDSKRLTAVEKRHYRIGLSRLRKDAMLFLKAPKSLYGSKAKCAVCEGAVESSR